MKVEKLTLKNFRNVQEATFLPDRTLNFLVGSNGQGKTSFLEAIGILSTLRSFRDSKTPSLIRWESLTSQISCTLSSEDKNLGDWKTELKVSLQKSPSDAQKGSQKATKTAYIDEKAYKSSVHYLSQRFGSYELGFHTIVFNPSDHDLVRGDPSTRRSYLDRVITAEDVDYLKTLQKYHRVLEQRNAILKSPHPLQSSLLREFTEPLCIYGSQLTHKRLFWIERLSACLNSILQKIAPSQPELRLAYLSHWVPENKNLSLNNSGSNSGLDFVHFTGQGSLPSLELLERSFWDKLSTSEMAERKQKYSLVGPHRDDWAFFFGGHPLKGHGSQGEVRSALLALKLSEIELFRTATGHKPLFLLDDFSSELDQMRREFLLKFLMESDLQTFITTTDSSSFLGKRYKISNGTIEEGIL